MVLYNNRKYNYLYIGQQNDKSTLWECVTRTCDPKLHTEKNNAFTLVNNYNEYYDTLNIWHLYR